MIMLASVAGVPLGLALRRNLSTLGYRTVDERGLADPGPRWWVVWASVLAIGTLAAGAALFDSQPVAYLPLLPLVISGPWLSAVDLDVMRIPNPVLARTAAGTVVALAGTAAAAREWRTLVLPVSAALMVGAVFVALHLATKSGIGFGDVKLAALIGLSVGPLGTGAVWLSVLAGSVAALVWAKVTRHVGPIPYGPWLLLGCWLAAISVALWG